MKYDYSIFCDCGAPSLYNKLSRKLKGRGSTGATFKNRKFDDYSYAESDDYNSYRDAYITWLHENKDKLTTYSNLDVINNPKKTLQNQRILEDAGLQPIPVFHLGNDEKWFRKYLDNYDHIALGGIFPNPVSVLIPMLDGLFKRNILDDDGFPRVKIHGFGCTSMPLLVRYPWYSVDSASARKLAIYGKIVVLEHTTDNIYHVSISSRDIAVSSRWTKGYVEEFTKRAAEYGMTIEELSTNVSARMLWNYTMFRLAIRKKVPEKWQWNYYTKEIKDGCDEEFIMYFAGSLSQKEEEDFWSAIAKDSNMHLARGRLQSFFYKTQLERIIKLKYK